MSQRDLVNTALKAVGAAKPRGIEDLIFNTDTGGIVPAKEVLDLASYGGANFAAAVLNFRDAPHDLHFKSLLTAAMAYAHVCKFKLASPTFTARGARPSPANTASLDIAKAAASAAQAATRN